MIAYGVVCMKSAKNKKLLIFFINFDLAKGRRMSSVPLAPLVAPLFAHLPSIATLTYGDARQKWIYILT